MGRSGSNVDDVLKREVAESTLGLAKGVEVSAVECLPFLLSAEADVLPAPAAHD